MRVLIVEDSFVNRKYLVKLLEPIAECDIAIDGMEAVEAFEMSLDDNQPYDLICLDILMPRMNGCEALANIRQIELDRGTMGLDCVKVIMTTMEDNPDKILGSFRTGCEAYILKPVRKERLFQEMEKLGLISQRVLEESLS